MFEKFLPSGVTALVIIAQLQCIAVCLFRDCDPVAETAASEQHAEPCHRDEAPADDGKSEGSGCSDDPLLRQFLPEKAQSMDVALVPRLLEPPSKWLQSAATGFAPERARPLPFTAASTIATTVLTL